MPSSGRGSGKVSFCAQRAQRSAEADRWLAGQAHLKPTTRERYAGIVRKHFVSPVTKTYLPLPGVDTSHPGAWVFSQKTIDSSVHRVPEFTVGSVCRATKSST